MQIKELQAKTGNVDIVVEIVEKGDVREFEKFGKPGKVCTARVKDETGETSLTLWNDEVEKVKVGDKVHIENGWVGEWQGELQLSAGKFGKIEVVGKGDTPAEQPKEEEPSYVEEEVN